MCLSCQIWLVRLLTRPDAAKLESLHDDVKERYDNDDVIDLVIVDDINGSSEWLLGDECLGGEGDVVYDDDLGWLRVEIASDVVEPVINTRSQAASQKAAAAAPSPQPQPKPSSSKGKAKIVVVDDEYVHDL